MIYLRVIPVRPGVVDFQIRSRGQTINLGLELIESVIMDLLWERDHGSDEQAARAWNRLRWMAQRELLRMCPIELQAKGLLPNHPAEVALGIDLSEGRIGVVHEDAVAIEKLVAELRRNEEEFFEAEQAAHEASKNLPYEDRMDKILLIEAAFLNKRNRILEEIQELQGACLICEWCEKQRESLLLWRNEGEFRFEGDDIYWDDYAN